MFLKICYNSKTNNLIKHDQTCSLDTSQKKMYKYEDAQPY